MSSKSRLWVHVRPPPKPKDDVAVVVNRSHQVRAIEDDVIRESKKQKARKYVKPRETVHQFNMKQNTTSVRYPLELCNLLKRAIQKVTSEPHARIVTSILLFPLLRGVADRFDAMEERQGRPKVVHLDKDGRKCYYTQELYRLAKPYLEKEEEKGSKGWIVKNYANVSVEDRDRFEKRYTQMSETAYVEYIVEWVFSNEG